MKSTPKHKIVVTGGSGFIGKFLVQKLLAEGHHVKVVDTKKIDIKHPNLLFIKKSVMENLRFNFLGYDAVFHLAAMLGVVSSDNNPLRTLENNIDGTVNVFRSALDTGIKKIIYSSSSEVYGEPISLPITEDSRKAPVSTYGISKLTAEVYARAFSIEYGMDIRPARFFNVYGPGQGSEWVIPIFIKKVIKGEPIPIFGSGEQVRCFTYVEDIISGLIAVFERGKFSEPYNIGNDHPTTLIELAQTIMKVLGKKVEIQICGYGSNTRKKEREIVKRIPSIDKIRKIGWRPTTSLEDGLYKTVVWYKKMMGI